MHFRQPFTMLVPRCTRLPVRRCPQSGLLPLKQTSERTSWRRDRLSDIERLAVEAANTQFQAQDRRNAYETVLAQLNAAKAAQQSAKLAMDSEISECTNYFRIWPCDSTSGISNTARSNSFHSATALLAPLRASCASLATAFQTAV